MKIDKTAAIAACICMLFSFAYGVVTVKYQVFPYRLLNTLHDIVSPESNLTPAHNNYFYEKKSFFEQHGTHDNDIVFVGDSITEGAEWEDLFPSLRIANRGIGRDRTDGVLERMDSIYSTNASKAFIMIGVNDFSAGAEVDDVVRNYTEILDGLVAHNMHAYIQSTLLTGNGLLKLNPKIRVLNHKLKAIAASSSSITYIDLNLGLADNSLLSTKYSSDGLHLNGSGYAVWKNLIEPYLE